MKTYICKSCGEEWEFVPADYKYNKKKYPVICPLCSMPVKQMIRDCYKFGGVKEVLKQLVKRYLINYEN